VTDSPYNFRVHLTPLNLSASPIRPWLSADPAGQKFLPTYLSDDWEPQMDPKKNFLWIAEEEGKEVGFFDFELDPSGAGYFVFYVAPEFRGRGLARKILEAGLETAEAKSCRYWEAGVEEDNAASRRVLESAGFENTGPDEDGMLMYRKVR
jgi:RimJ/RimL family protein N-acetyltransferase